MLGGGGTDDDGMRWLADRAGGGDFLTIRSSGDDNNNPYVAGLAKPNSTETILFRARSAARDRQLVEKVRRAEAIFIAGGDQERHRKMWRGTPVIRAVNEAAARGVPLGGTSAGLAMMGSAMFYSLGPNMVTSAEALANPTSKRIIIDRGMLDLPDLRGVLTDTHFSQRDRLGRLVVFLARLASEGHPARGIGVDEDTSLAVDENGIGTVTGAHHVTIVETTTMPSVYAPGRPLSIDGVQLRRLAPGDRFDLRNWRTSDGTRHVVTVRDGVLSVRDIPDAH